MISVELQTGEAVELTLNFGLLYRLKSVEPEEYKAYFKAFNETSNTGGDQTFTMLRIIYTGYLCTMLKGDKLKEALSFEDFIGLLPEDTMLVLYTGTALLNPKQTIALERYLGKAPKAKKGTA